jgi:diguanylate cyclase (GGDEF)-like protein/PAS domain S-box-containing protein
MSPSAPAWTVIGIVAAVVTATLLLAGRRRDVPANRWLALVAVAWGAAFAVQGVGAGPVTSSVIELTLGDLLALLGLPALVVALVRMAPSRPSDSGAAAPDSDGARSDGAPAPRTGADGPAPGRHRDDRVIDACLLWLAVFCAGWIAVLRSAYRASGVGPGFFTIDLIHPALDLAVLGCTLWLAIRAGRRGLVPYLALCAATVGDFLAVQARATSMHPGSWPQLCWLAAIALLGACTVPALAGSPGSGVPDRATADRDLTPPAAAGPAEPPLAALVVLSAAGAAALITVIFAIVTWGRSGPVPLVAASVLTLGLAVKVVSVLRQAAAMSAFAEESDSQFHQLADRTSDVVLLCDDAGLVGYASRAVGHFGYTPAQLTGTQLPDLVHPDDLRSVVTAAAAARSAGPAAAVDLACRVRSSDGTWRHVRATVSRYSEADRPDLLLVTARDVSDQVALRRQVTHLTFHDGVTGLPNRSYLEERTKDLLTRQAAATGSPDRIGAIFVDLDGFTAINDSVGHGAGDLVLAQAGRRLRGLVPAHDTVARWGGDEFAVLIESAASPQEIVETAERLAGAIAAEPFQVAGREMTITASLGVAFADPDVAEHLLRNADLAMSRAKNAGGGRVEVFAAHMHADVLRRLELATGLRAAIEDGGFSLEYQPVVELSTSRISSVEALVRWSRAGTPVAPAEFLGVAEDSGLIVPLGTAVLNRACQQVGAWRDAGWQVGLSVNFSLRQLSSAGFADSVLAALADAGLPRSVLTLEVTERVLIDVGGPVMAALARLRQLGVRLAIDDFGTGYASLAYLRQLPVDTIKIDPSFVAGLGTDGTLAMLTRTIVQVGHDLGIEIVAEGIERPEQLELLRAMGCGLGQGYLVAAPMSAKAIEALAPAAGEPELELVLPEPPDTGISPAGPLSSPSAAPAG